ncbi:DUF2946 domain-containing protein [Phytobacter sp. V91]|uniref:DUF2946 domain-containing protein n=1 Tax=Phytobacter sp. V91 TaxID=3369425 RepID=UPI003F61E013
MYGRNFFNTLSAWLALLAVAMLFVAPVVSKSLQHHTPCQPATAMMNMDMHGMHHAETTAAACDSPPAPHHFLSAGAGQSLMEDIACGYCQLLIHLPFVLFVLAVLLWLWRICVPSSAFPALRCPLIFRPWDPKSARAPPCCYVFDC